MMKKCGKKQHTNIDLKKERNSAHVEELPVADIYLFLETLAYTNA